MSPSTYIRKKQATCTRSWVWGKPLWSLCYDPHTELMIEVTRTHISTHKHRTQHEPSCPAVDPIHRDSLTLPSSTISFVFGQMQCSGPGGSNTLCGAITQKQSVTTHSDFMFFSLALSILCTSTASQDLSTAGWLSLNLQVFFPPQYKDKFVIVNVIALGHLSTPPDSVTQFI